MEILNTELGRPWIVLLVVGVLFVAIGLLGLFIFYKDIKSGEINGSIISIPIVIIFGIYISIVSFNMDNKIRHEVIIEDFNEVYNNDYEIKERRGEIYIIEKDISRNKKE